MRAYFLKLTKDTYKSYSLISIINLKIVFTTILNFYFIIRAFTFANSNFQVISP